MGGTDSISTKVFGYANKTDVNVKNSDKNEKVSTEVVGEGNTTTITINNYDSAKAAGQRSAKNGVGHAPKTAPTAPHESPKKSQTPTTQPHEPTKKSQTPPATTPQKPTEPKMSVREIEQRAKQLADASNGIGTEEEKFYNSVTTVPGGETESSSKAGDVKTMDKRVFLSKDNLVALDKYLKTHQLADVHRPLSQAGGIRSYVNAEFDVKDRNDFYNNKMRELVNLLDEYKIK